MPDDTCQVWFCDEEKVRQIEQELERQDVQRAALLFKALADESRLKVAFALSQAEMCVCDVARLIGASSSVASYHLRTLRNLGLARYRKDGKMVYYSLSSARVESLVRAAFQGQSSEAHSSEARSAGAEGSGAGSSETHSSEEVASWPTPVR